MQDTRANAVGEYLGVGGGKNYKDLDFQKVYGLKFLRVKRIIKNQLQFISTRIGSVKFTILL